MELAYPLFVILLWAAGVAIVLLIAYHLIRAAVRGALSDHYKTVRWYEQTGEWHPGNHGSGSPKAFDEL